MDATKKAAFLVEYLGAGWEQVLQAFPEHCAKLADKAERQADELNRWQETAIFLETANGKLSKKVGNLEDDLAIWKDAISDQS